tara:strand:+ start:2013 stop:2579 length:567 start_codon:yes stop_codon:yes gene_type:complete
MKWIGQQIYDQVSRFKNDVFFEDAVSLSSGLTVTGTTTFNSTTSGRPSVNIENTGNNTSGGTFKFTLDKGAIGADSDIPGIIEWAGDNDAQQQTAFGQLYAQVADATDGQEAGSMVFKVAAYDGVLETALKLDGDTNADGEVDVVIGSGTGSTTTITSGVVMMGSLPTSDPGVSGQIWNNGGVLNVSE